MSVNLNAKSFVCELTDNTPVNDEVFTLLFNWDGPAPRAGQFFMINPLRSSFFLARPISIFEYNGNQKTVKLLIAKAGKGTNDLAGMKAGEKIEVLGPLGNAWADFLPEKGKVALLGGSVGIAPLAALVAEKTDYHFEFYAGFKKGFRDKNEEDAMIGCARGAKRLIIAADDGKNALFGPITDFIVDLESYDVLFACGSAALLKAVIAKCKQKKVRCYVSMESRMACGVGACLGCTVKTSKGGKRCCCDGPIFASEEIIFND
jgi:NAD(P)H-flavin reductase